MNPSHIFSKASGFALAIVLGACAQDVSDGDSAAGASTGNGAANDGNTYEFDDRIVFPSNGSQANSDSNSSDFRMYTSGDDARSSNAEPSAQSGVNEGVISIERGRFARAGIYTRFPQVDMGDASRTNVCLRVMFWSSAGTEITVAPAETSDMNHALTDATNEVGVYALSVPGSVDAISIASTEMNDSRQIAPRTDAWVEAAFEFNNEGAFIQLDGAASSRTQIGKRAHGFLGVLRIGLSARDLKPSTTHVESVSLTSGRCPFRDQAPSSQ